MKNDNSVQFMIPLINLITEEYCNNQRKKQECISKGATDSDPLIAAVVKLSEKELHMLSRSVIEYVFATMGRAADEYDEY